MSFLKEHFISTSCLVVDLEDLKKGKGEAAKVATMFLENYKFPVMMMVSLSNGTILNKVNANDLLDAPSDFWNTGFQNPTTVSYLNFLKTGFQNSLKYKTRPNI
ncbi:Hypothetical predicted protein [Octopus vulgaris]|uniref:Uncharacterized protein n=2 Tax=Octopus TaxID=6643 RepID=A0AA36B0V1_OCTVU|nr:Hypothetical predicted protein [Octopus vulgaris]